MAQHSQMAGNMFHSSSSGIEEQNKPRFIPEKEGIVDRLGIWKAASPNLVDPMQRASYGAENDSGIHRDDHGNIQQHLDNNSVEKAIPQQKFRDNTQILESYAHTNASNVLAESSEMRNSAKENSSNSFRSKFSPESFTCGFKETTQVNARDMSMLLGGNETQSPSRPDGLVGQTVSQSFGNKNHEAPQQINPQIAPSRYSQYGSFKNGLVQPVNDTGRFTPSKIEVEKSVDVLHSVKPSRQLTTADPSFVFHMQQISGYPPGTEILSSESLPQGATGKILKVDKPKKRKTATSELLSWNKEITEGPTRLKTLGEAEVDWARATNRLAEKVGFETSLEDGSLIRSKRRFIYATKLMQQLFCPPSARVISLVASSNYEFIVYTAARTALGDACSSSSSTDPSESFSPPNNSNPLSERMKTEKISDQYISKAAEDFISRTRKLETAFAGLENGTTISDLSIEVQDLEKFAVINRFASFHQSSSSTTDRTTSSHRLNPQRYVTIAPMPRNIPDRIQCLSF